MGTIQEVIEDVKESVGDKGFYIIVGGGILILIFLLLSNNNEEENSPNYQVVSSYASYPDSVTNADVIIDTIQNNIDYSESNIKEFMRDNFDVTNDYITDGLEKTVELNNKLQDTTIQSTDTIRNDINTVSNKVDTVQNTISNTVVPKIDTVQKTATTVKNTVTNTAKSVKKVETNTNSIKKVVNNKTVKPKLTAKTTAKTKSNTIKKTTYKGSSIVDGLKSVGVNSSYSNRKKLAEANGIKNYTGSVSQNTALLNKLKRGTLKKAK